MQKGEIRSGDAKTIQETSLRKHFHQADDKIRLVILQLGFSIKWAI